MKRLSRVALAGLLIALAGLVWLMVLGRGSREPFYDGKPLSEWLRAFDYYAKPDQPGTSVRDARRAIRAAGTNAIPTLLRMLRATDSTLKLNLIDLLQKQHLVNFRFRTASRLHAEAVTAFHYLGVRAELAVPELIKMFNETPPLPARASIAHVLGNLGPAAEDAIPSLQRALTNTNRSVASAATNALANINTNDRSPWEENLQWGLYGSDAAERVEMLFESRVRRAVVPELLSMLKNPGTNDYWVRFALQQIDPDTAAKVLTNSHPNVHATELVKSSSEVANAAHLLAVGDWSEPIQAARLNTLRGRLLVYASPNSTHRSALSCVNAQVYLELQDVSQSLAPAPAAVYVDCRDLHEYEIQDAHGSPVPPDSEVQRPFPPAFWVIVPFDGTVRFRIDTHGSGVVSEPSPDGLAIQLGNRDWRIPVGATNDYFLSGTFTPPTNQSNPLYYDVWGGTLKLPPVKISSSKP